MRSMILSKVAFTAEGPMGIAPGFDLHGRVSD
jgi:hypothetical protein